MFKLLIGVLLVTAASIHADVVFSNYGPGTSVCTTCSWWDTGAHPPEQAYYRGMPFTAPSVPSGSDFKLDSIMLTVFESCSLPFAIQCDGYPQPTFVVSIQADDHGLPGAVLEQFTFTNLSGSSYENPVLVSGTSITHPTLSAGRQFWVTTAVTNSDLTPRNVGWVFNSQGSTGLVASHAGDTLWVIPYGTEPQTLGAFRITGSPLESEPDTVFLWFFYS